MSLLTRANAVAQVIVDNLDAPAPSSDDTHHLAKVLRVRNGEKVIATDGRGSWRECEWSEGLHPAADMQFEDAPKHTQIAFAITKSDKPEWTIQKLTEIGIARIVPFISEHTVVKWDEHKVQKHVARFQRVAYEAAMQSRRVWLPEVTTVVTFDEMLAQEFALAAPGGDELSRDVDKIAIGPEGGWSTEELRRVRICVSLGSTILRAETAAMVAAVRLAQFT